jgi:ribosomal protein S18 acetylase RimI-like enzyme
LQVTLRPATAADDPFLYRLFEATHGQQFALLPLEPAHREALVHMQFNAQRGGYRAQRPEAKDFIVFGDAEPVGRLWVDDSSPAALHVLDVAILPEQQGRGAGKAVLKRVMDQAAGAGKAVTLNVDLMNVRAIEFYRRLGFEVTGTDEMNAAMRWQA